MTLYEFNALDQMRQAEAVWDGQFIDDREDQDHKILLYQVDSFYVEVYYHKQQNAIKRFRSFCSTDQLQPYLQRIDISRIG
jgi:hypothetical protein